MSKRRIAGLMAVAALMAAGWLAQGEALTGAGYELGASARGLGLGGAFTALVDDATAALHNPAALAEVEGLGISSLYARQFGDISYGSISLAVPWFGVNAAFLDSGMIASSSGAFRYTSQALSLAGGVPIGPISVGVRWRYVRVSSPGAGTGWTLAPALLVDLESVRIAALVDGALSDGMHYDSGAVEVFEPSVRAAIAARLSPSPDVWWNASFEASGLFSSHVGYCAGIEAWIGSLGARVGYDGQGLTAGLTIGIAGLTLDWGYAMRADLGDSHRVSVTVEF